MVLGVLAQPVERDPGGAALVEDGGDGHAREGGVEVEADDGGVLGGGGAAGPEEAPALVADPGVEPRLPLARDDGGDPHHALDVHLDHGARALGPRAAEADEEVLAVHDEGRGAILPADEGERRDSGHRVEVHLDQLSWRGGGAEQAQLSVARAAQQLVFSWVQLQVRHSIERRNLHFDDAPRHGVHGEE